MKRERFSVTNPRNAWGALVLGILVAGCGENLSMDALVPQEASIPQTHLECLEVLDSLEVSGILPGLTTSIFTADSIVFQDTWGYGPDGLDQSQMLASITETLTGLRLSEAVEDGKIALEDAVQDYLPFVWQHPQASEVTFVHLATHTSGLEDPSTGDQGYRFKEPLDPRDFSAAYVDLVEHYNHTTPYTLSEYLELHLSGVPGETGQGSYLTAPGDAYNYSNLGIALLSLALDSAYGSTLKEWSAARWFEPLGLDETAWSYTELSEVQLAAMQNEDRNWVPPYDIITYPDGGLWTSPNDLTTLGMRWLQEARGDHGERYQRIQQRAWSVHYEGEDSTEGLCFDLNFPGLVGHAGNDFGTATLLYFQSSNGLGRLLFAPITVEYERQEDDYYGAYNTLFEIDWLNENPSTP